MRTLLPSGSMAFDRLALRGFAFSVFFFATLVALTLATSAVGGSCDRWVVVGIGSASALLAYLLAKRVSPGRLEHRQDGGFVRGLALLTVAAWCVQFVRVLMIVSARPIYDWDGLYYHVPAIAGWVQAGRVTWLADLVDLPFANGYSMGCEVLSFLGFQLSGSGDWMAATTLLLWPMGLLALVHLARQCGATVAWAWIVGAATAQIPVFAALSTTMYVDAAFAIATWCAIASVVHWASLQSRATFADAALLGASVGLCATFKGLGWIVAMVLAVFLAWHWFRARVTAPRTALQFALAAGFVVAVAGYWPARNVVHTGNPIHPLEFRLGHKLLAEGYDARQLVRQDMPVELRRLPAMARPPRAWVRFDAADSGHYALGGLGILWVGFGLPSLLWLSFRRRPSTWPRWLGLFALALLAVQPANWWSRFTLWLHGIGLPAAGLASSIVVGRTRRTLCEAGVLAVLVVAGMETDAALRWESRQGVDPDTGEQLSNFDYYFPRFTAQPFAEQLLASRSIARGRWGRMGTLLGGALALPPGERSIRVIDEPMTVELLEELRADGVDWLIWDHNSNAAMSESVRAAAARAFEYRAEPDIELTLLRL